jgi:hypothetical protein
MQSASLASRIPLQSTSRLLSCEHRSAIKVHENAVANRRSVAVTSFPSQHDPSQHVYHRIACLTAMKLALWTVLQSSASFRTSVKRFRAASETAATLLLSAEEGINSPRSNKANGLSVPQNQVTS